MTVLHSGSNNKYSSNWALAFGAKGGKAGATAGGKKTTASAGKGAKRSAKSTAKPKKK